jgi:hypothetical protein
MSHQQVEFGEDSGITRLRGSDIRFDARIIRERILVAIFPSG